MKTPKHRRKEREPVAGGVSLTPVPPPTPVKDAKTAGDKDKDAGGTGTPKEGE